MKWEEISFLIQEAFLIDLNLSCDASFQTGDGQERSGGSAAAPASDASVVGHGLGWVSIWACWPWLELTFRATWTITLN